MEKENGNRKSKTQKMEFIILAGEMNIVSGKIKPNPAKGQIRFYINPDDILCMEWINFESKYTSEPIAIFEEEWEWKRIETMRGRVYVLQNKTFKDTQNFFWMQYPNKGEDSLNENLINKILKTGRLQLEEDDENQDDELITVENIVKKEETLPIKTDNSNSTTQPKHIHATNTDFIKSFTSALRNVEKYKFPSLGKILTKSNIVKYFNESDIEQLTKLLPDNQQSRRYFIENISSPQFQQALESLSSALNSENLQYIIQSFGLNMDTSLKFPDGVEAFIRCIIEKFSKKEK